jgi:hypothetical protein
MELEITQEPRDTKGKEYRFNECVQMKIDHDRDGVCLTLKGLNQQPQKSNTRYYITVKLCLDEISKIVGTVTAALDKIGPMSIDLENKVERLERRLAESEDDK